MASLTTIVKTQGCGACDGIPGVLHANNCPNNPNFNAEATAQSIKKAAEKARKRADDLAAEKAAIDITTLTYLITDGDVGEAKNGSYDKILTVQIINADGDIVGTWSIYFYFSSGVGGGSGKERRIFNTAHLGHHILINDAYQKLGLSRFMGKILAEKIEGMIEAKKLREDDLFYIESDATGTFWENMGMTTTQQRDIEPPEHQFDWTPTIEWDDRYMYVGEFISWANGTQKGTKQTSIDRLDYLTGVINQNTGKKSSFGGGRKKRTRKRRKTRKKSKKKRKRKTRKNKQFLYNPNNPKKSFDVYIDKNPKDTIPIKYTTVKDVKNTIKKLEKLFKTKKYPHKRIWQVGMIMKVRLEAMLKHKTKKYPNAKKVKQRFNIANKYFKFLGDRTNKKTFLERKKMKFLL